MPSRAGKNCAVYVAGTPTAFTTEAFTTVVANKEYQITNTARRVWDRTATITVFIGGTPMAANGADPWTLDRLRGKIIFTITQARGAVTATGTYLPMAALVKAKSFMYDITRPVLDDTGFGDTWRTHIAGQVFDIRGSLGRWYQASYELRDPIINDAVYVLAFMIPDLTTPELLVWARIKQFALQVANDTLFDESVEWEGTTDADGRAASSV
jgi:hypothetical protein